MTISTFIHNFDTPKIRTGCRIVTVLYLVILYEYLYNSHVPAPPSRPPLPEGEYSGSRR